MGPKADASSSHGRRLLFGSSLLARQSAAVGREIPRDRLPEPPRDISRNAVGSRLGPIHCLAYRRSQLLLGNKLAKLVWCHLVTPRPRFNEVSKQALKVLSVRFAVQRVDVLSRIGLQPLLNDRHDFRGGALNWNRLGNLFGLAHSLKQ